MILLAFGNIYGNIRIHCFLEILRADVVLQISLPDFYSDFVNIVFATVRSA